MQDLRMELTDMTYRGKIEKVIITTFYGGFYAKDNINDINGSYNSFVFNACWL